MGKKENKYDSYTSSFSGTDMVVSFVFPEAAPIIVGTATTATYSIYRQLAHVRTLGRITAKGYARGGRTCGGTIIFTVIKESIVEDVRRRVDYLGDFKTLKPDELPPFDIILTSGNEFGQSSTLVIYGASIVDESQTHSIEDIFTENVFTFLARDIQHMKSGDLTVTSSGSFRGADEDLGKFKLSELIANKEDSARKKKLAELARAEKARWEEPVMTDPSTPKSDSSKGGGKADSKHGSVTIQVFGEKGKSKTALAKATVWQKDSSGKKVTVKTDKNGYAKFSPDLDAAYTYTAYMEGYAENSTSITVKKSDTSVSKTITLSYVDSKPPSGGKNEVAITKYDGPSKYDKSTKGKQTLTEIWSGNNGPSMKVTNSSGSPLANIPITYSFVIHNSSKCPTFKKPLFRLAWPHDKGDLTTTYTNAKGEVFAPAFMYGKLFDSCDIEIIAKPYCTADKSSGLTKKSLWKSWRFIKDNG